MLCAVRVQEEEEDVEWHLLYFVLQSVCLSVGLTQEVKNLHYKCHMLTYLWDPRCEISRLHASAFLVVHRTSCLSVMQNSILI